jgi:hypothetical protein
MNRRPRTFSFLLFGFALVIAGCSRPAPPPPAPAGPPVLTAAQRRPYLGSYTITTPEGERIAFRVYESEGMLLGQPGTEAPVRMVYLGDNLFRTEGQYDYMVTFVIENGVAARFTARSGDTVLQGQRLP